MIITRIIGGLGNQMFQYAAGRALSLRLHTECKIDISGFKTYPLHNGYGLGAFVLHPEIATDEEIINLRGNEGGVSRLFRRIGLSSASYFKEKSLGFNPSYLTLGNNHFLDGYWQSEKYFSSYEKIIRQDFEFAHPLSSQNQIFKDKIKNTHSVSLHIRRGDYVNDAKTNHFHGTCSPEYYQKAVHLIAEKIISPVFFVFSDDIAWCKTNLNLEFPTYFVDTSNDVSPHEDMHLMSLCSHHIIANSTFSWWGAWLNPNPTKMVIAPKQWFANPRIKNPDIIPNNWISL